MKSLMTLNRSLFRTAQQLSAFAHRRGETVVEYKQGWLYCYPLAELSDIFNNVPDGNEVVAIYNSKDCYIWRKTRESSSRSNFSA